MLKKMLHVTSYKLQDTLHMLHVTSSRVLLNHVTCNWILFVTCNELSLVTAVLPVTRNGVRI